MTRPDAPPPAWLVVVFFLAFAALYLYLHRADLAYAWLEDLPIYKAAIHAFLAGRDPYAETYFGLNFVYSPIVLYPVSWLARLMPGESEWVVFPAVHLVCILATPLVLARYYFSTAWLTAGVAYFVFLAETDFTGMRALFSANVAPSLYLAVLLALAPGIRRNRWHWFYAVVFLAAMFKVTFLVMLLFPVLTGARQWVRSSLVATAVAALYVAQRLRLPTLYAGYKWALVQQVVVQRRYGYGFFGTAAVLEHKLHRSVEGSYIVHAMFALTLIGLLFLLKRRGAGTALPGEQSCETIWLGVVLMSVLLISPRVLHYDMYLALFAASVTLVALFHLSGWKVVALVSAVYLPCLIVLPYVRPPLIPQTYSLVLVLAALGGGIWRLWRATSGIAVPFQRQLNTESAHSASTFVGVASISGKVDRLCG